MNVRNILHSYSLRQQARMMPQRVLGKTGLVVSAFGLGGQALLEIEGHQRDTCLLINKAIDLGVTYFDTAAIYGPSRFYLGQSLGMRRSQITLASKVYQRDYKGAKNELDESFKLLKTPVIDIVQLHGIKDQSDKNVLMKDGALQVLIEAKKAGKIRFIGVTGHYDPQILSEFIDLFDFDTILMALNPAVPEFVDLAKKARQKNMGIIAMKVMARGILPEAFPSDKLLQWAIHRSHVAIIGCSNETDLERNIIAASEYSETIDFEFEMDSKLQNRAAFFAKGREGQRWPATYQPNLPTIQYDK